MIDPAIEFRIDVRTDAQYRVTGPTNWDGEGKIR